MRFKKSIFLFGLVFFIFLIFLLTFSLSYRKELNLIDKNQQKIEIERENQLSPKEADYWNENEVDHIYLYNDNWSATDLEWIQNRTGTWSDPHIIENVTIDGGKYGIGILIENSDDYFIIRNCTIYNSSVGQFEKAGILLKNTNNGTIINNNLSNNNGSGLILENCISNKILSNNITYNKEYGICLIGQSQNNTMSGNNFDNNSKYGIFCNFTTSRNIIYNNNFTKNEINAWDNGTENSWHLGKTGNYWDDYKGCDSNGDNRGEFSYKIPGSAVAQDPYPICYKKCPSSPREAKPATEEDNELKEVYSAANQVFENIIYNIGFVALGLIIVEIAVGLLIFVNKNRKYRLNDKFLNID